MPSVSASAYSDFIEGKLISAIATGTTTGATVKIKQINGDTPTWPTAKHRIKIVQRTATNTKVEKIEVAAGTTQSGQTVTLGTLTRALSLSDGTNFTGGVGTAQTFTSGADVFITWDTHDAAQTAKLDIANTFTGSGAIRSSSTTTAVVRHNSMTTAQRLAMTPGNGDVVYDSTLSQLYKYEGGAWAAQATGTFSNAADHTGGKVDIGSATEIGDGTAIDATSGAINVIPVSQTAKTSSGASDENKLPVLDSSGRVADGFLGTGTASNANFLRGDRSWTAIIQSEKTIRLTAFDFVQTKTNGCSAPTTDENTVVNLRTLDFDSVTEENAFTQFTFPANYSGGTCTAHIFWTNTTSSTAGETVDWEISMVSIADGETWPSAYGTGVTVTDTAQDDLDIHKSPESGAITIGGTPAAGEIISLRIARKVGTDNMAGDARFIAIVITYT